MEPAAEGFYALAHDLSLVCWFRNDGTWERINHHLDARPREDGSGREPHGGCDR